MPLSIPLFYNIDKVITCFSDDTMSTLLHKIHKLKTTQIAHEKLYYIDFLSSPYYINFDKNMQCNIFATTTNQVVDTIQHDSLISELKHIPLCFLVDVDANTILSKYGGIEGVKNCKSCNLDLTDNIKMDIGIKYKGSEDKSIHESIFFKELVLKVVTNQIIGNTH